MTDPASAIGDRLREIRASMNISLNEASKMTGVSKPMLEPDLEEEFAEFHVRRMTNEVTRLSKLVQNKSQVITGTDEYDRIVVIDELEIVALHAEKKWCRIYTDTRDFSCRKRLYEIENMLGRDFMRISKSIIVNLRKIESVEAVSAKQKLEFQRVETWVIRVYFSDKKFTQEANP